MSKNSQSGNIVIEVVLSVAFVAALVFGVWAFAGRQDYKNNLSQKVTVAVNARENDLQKQAQDKIDALNVKQFAGPSTYGTISFNYPKTWSAYVDSTNPSEPINAYFYPGEVPGVSGPTAFALRLELVSTPYSQVVQQMSSQLSNGQLKATAYVPPKMAKVANVQTGTRFDGVIGQNSQGSSQTGAMVVITVRDKTMQLYTQANNFLSDFDNVILPSLTFVP